MENSKEELLHWLEYYQKSTDKPGVYWFMDEEGKVIYVGKAKNLHNRLTSYTQLTQLHGKTRKMVLEAKRLKFQELTNELEALLIEAELIRLHQPHYNILLKDDKSPLYIYVTNDEFPLVKTIRKKDLQKLRLGGESGIKEKDIFGPYQSAFRAKEILKIVRPIFQWCDHPLRRDQILDIRYPYSSEAKRVSSIKYPISVPKSCFYYHIGRCSGACLGLISKEEYTASIDRLKKFLKGKTKEVVDDFKQAMNAASEHQEYERAAVLRDQIRLIEEVLKPTFHLKPDLQLPKLNESLAKEGLVHLRNEIRHSYALPSDYPLDRIEGFDVSNIQGTNATVSMVTFTEGKPDKANYRLFNIRTLDTPNDYHMMKEAVTRRQNHPEWGLPNLILIDGGRGQLRAALSVWNWTVPVVSIVKNPDRLVIPVFEEGKQFSLKNLKYHFVHFPPDHPTLRLLEQIRDESHRFAKKQHTRLRNRDIVEK